MNINKGIRACIALYQTILSPDKNIFWKRAPSCIFTPTCSEYSMEAFRRFHFFKAFFYSIRRILRCNPVSHGGHDPLVY